MTASGRVMQIADVEPTSAASQSSVSRPPGTFAQLLLRMLSTMRAICSDKRRSGARDPRHDDARLAVDVGIVT